MKSSHILSFLMSAALCLATGSCTLESSDNGKLDGFWHIESIDTLPAGGHADLSGQLLFWSFQHHLMELNDRNYALPRVMMRFSHRNDSLVLSEPRINDRMAGDTAFTDIGAIAPFGVNGPNDAYAVEQLKDDKMVLKNNRLRINFKRF